MLAITLLISLLTHLPSQETKATHPPKETATQESEPAPFRCAQPAAERDSLMREAVVNQYHVRRVEFAGNAYTRDSSVAAKDYLQEGDVFVRENLVKTLRSLSRLKIIYPVKLGDVIISLDSSEKIIDMTICVKERRKRNPPLSLLVKTGARNRQFA